MEPLVVQFSDDNLDESPALKAALPRAVNSRLAKLQGTHLTPLAVDPDARSNGLLPIPDALEEALGRPGLRANLLGDADVLVEQVDSYFTSRMAAAEAEATEKEAEAAEAAAAEVEAEAATAAKAAEETAAKAAEEAAAKAAEEAAAKAAEEAAAVEATASAAAEAAAVAKIAEVAAADQAKAAWQAKLDAPEEVEEAGAKAVETEKVQKKPSSSSEKKKKNKKQKKKVD